MAQVQATPSKHGRIADGHGVANLITRRMAAPTVETSETYGRSSLAADLNGGGRPLGTRLELADHLAGMASSLGSVDPRAAERLEDLAHAVGTEEGRLRWGEVDLRRAFNAERLAHAYAVHREGGFASRAILPRLSRIAWCVASCMPSPEPSATTFCGSNFTGALLTR